MSFQAETGRSVSLFKYAAHSRRRCRVRGQKFKEGRGRPFHRAMLHIGRYSQEEVGGRRVQPRCRAAHTLLAKEFGLLLSTRWRKRGNKIQAETVKMCAMANAPLKRQRKKTVVLAGSKASSWSSSSERNAVSGVGNGHRHTWSQLGHDVEAMTDTYIQFCFIFEIGNSSFIIRGGNGVSFSFMALFSISTVDADVTSYSYNPFARHASFLEPKKLILMILNILPCLILESRHTFSLERS